MAVELGLNRWMPKAPEGETEQEKRERRNRERTYLVLFTHDRSLSMQTGRQWMLPEVMHLVIIKMSPTSSNTHTLQRMISSDTQVLGTRIRICGRRTLWSLLFASSDAWRYVSSACVKDNVAEIEWQAETTDVFYLHKGAPAGALHSDVNYEILLLSCNGKLTHWMEVWQGEMKKGRDSSSILSLVLLIHLGIQLVASSSICHICHSSACMSDCS
jgi:hypothetical protein